VTIATTPPPEILNIAAKNGHDDVIRELLKNGASVKILKRHGWPLFIIAAENGHLEEVRQLLTPVAK
jgi:ankyrin repeat protein